MAAPSSGQTDGPGTHALIVGVGNYPRLFRPKSTEGPVCARHIQRWLEAEFRNLSAPLASVEVLASTPDLPVDQEAFFAALLQWHGRLHAHPDNLGLFYFAGSAFARAQEVLLVLDDFLDREPSPIGLVSSTDLIYAMRSSRAGRKAFFLDVMLEPAPRAFADMQMTSLIETGRPREADTLSALYYLAREERGGEDGKLGELPIFTDALIQVLTSAGERGTPLSTAQLREELNERIGELRSRAGLERTQLNSTLEGEFVLFDASPAPVSAPPEQPEISIAQQESADRPSAAGPAEPEPTTSPTPGSDLPVETYTEFVTDNAEVEVDTLDRGALAISLARQLHRIWRKSNGLDAAPAGGARSNEGGAFVLHLDAPWGGGKTTFAHFVARVLNPYAAPSRKPPAFLAERYGKSFNFAELFLERGWRSDSRRSWITVWFNAWQAEDCRPPWWVFYQTIRKGCFDAIREEGDEPLDVGRKAKAPPLVPADWERHERWRSLMWREYAWRLGDPKVMALLLTALISILAAALLWATGAIGPGDKGGVSIVTDNIPGFVLATITGISALWGLGALVTESIVPGTNSLAERLSLGSMDPFQRFRDHFSRSMEAVRRPVMVIVDDLDRCKPEFIVDLLRGIQILLRSPRVVFVILGDREWIERAFEHHHEALSKVNVGPEQSLGARFVEKTIQMSFILPGMRHKQTAYVRRILLGAVEGPAKGPGRGAPKMAAQVRDAVKQVTSTARHAVLDSEGLRSEVRKEIARRSKDRHSTAGPDPLLSQTIDEEVAIHVSADESAEREIVHLLQRLAPYFPSNPRQIKRIINAMTTYTSVAIGVAPDTLNVARLTQLAIWVTLMTEWPETWRLLASCPELADVISAGDKAEAQLAAFTPGVLPGSPEATLREVQRIVRDPSLRGLIIGEGREGPRLDTAAINELVDLTPLYRGRRRLAEADGKGPPARRPPAVPRRTPKKKAPVRR